ncbi:hypothetical protein Tco_0712258, partial [Tanacetum coccineum]
KITNPQETQQVAARDEKWVPSADRVKIRSTNLRLETIVPQKEETFQVMIDVIKNSTCFKAFTISANKCRVDAEVFREILDICPRVEGEQFTKLQNDDDTLALLLDLGYKGPLHKYTNIYVDRMSQPWRTLAAIIRKSLSGKTTSNDRLRKSRIDIMKERRSRRENMPYPRFTKIIINHFLKQHKFLSNLKYQHYHIIKDDGIISRLKFVRIGEDYHEYELEISDVMLNDTIKQSESYQMFIKISTSQIPPKKNKGKGSQGKKTVDDPQEMTASFLAPTEGYEDAIVIPEINANFELKHGLINLVQNKQFFGHDKEDPHAHIRYFNKITSTMRFPDIPSTSIKLMLFPFFLEDSLPALTTEVSELKNMMKTMLVEKQKAQAPAPVKAVEQSCVTCGGAHSYRNCPATDGNIYQDNIQEYVSQAAAANFNQGNTNSRPPMNSMWIHQPPTSQPPVYQAQPYQAPAQQVQGVSKTNFENYVKANDAVLRNMQNQGQGLQNQIANLTDMLSKFVNANTASSLGTGTLPSNTVTNLKEDLKVERETEVTKDTMPPTNNGSTEDVQPPVVPVVHQNQSLIPVNAPS